MAIELTEAQVLSLKRDDVVVARIPKSMDTRTAYQCRAVLQGAVPDGVRVVALPAEVELEVVSVEPF